MSATNFIAITATWLELTPDRRSISVLKLTMSRSSHDFGVAGDSADIIEAVR